MEGKAPRPRPSGLTTLVPVLLTGPHALEMYEISAEDHTHTRASGLPLTLSYATYKGGKGLLVLSFEATSYGAGCC